MKLVLAIILGIFLLLASMGCARLNTYPPGYQPSDWEKSIGPPDWYLNEADGLYDFETVD